MVEGIVRQIPIGIISRSASSSVSIPGLVITGIPGDTSPSHGNRFRDVAELVVAEVLLPNSCGGWPTSDLGPNRISVLTRGAPFLALFARSGDFTSRFPRSFVTDHDLPLAYDLLMPWSLKRYYGAGHLHFITCSCYHRQPWLGSAYRRDLLLSVLEQMRQRYSFVVAGYVVMPEHFHLLISQPQEVSPSTVIQAAIAK